MSSKNFHPLLFLAYKTSDFLGGSKYQKNSFQIVLTMHKFGVKTVFSDAWRGLEWLAYASLYLFW